MSSSIQDLIREKHNQIHSKKDQCQQLCLCIDQLVDPLERLEHASSIFIRPETRPVLNSLLKCIDDCNNFIETLKLTNRSDEYENDCKRFEELNNRLSQLGQDLCLGLCVQEIFFQRQDREDQDRIFKS